MHWGSPIFVLAIIAMVMIAKVASTAIRARHGYSLHDSYDGPRGRRGRGDRDTELLAAENEKLKGMIVRLEDRLSTLERIATDEPHRLSAEIERLR